MTVDYHSLLFEAINSPRGIELRTSDPEFLRQKLYQARKADPLFATLSFVISPTSPKDSLWIIKRQEIVHVSPQDS